MADLMQMKERISELKRERDAVIVAHTYQLGEIQEIADMVGDSYALSKFCAASEANTIVFCGVGFMAESAKLLSPEKRVLLPEKLAGCPMADMLSADELREFKSQHPGAAVVTYINSSAAVKAESDCIVTSSNALKVVGNMKERVILFGPDRNLGSYIASQMPDKEFIMWKGFCPTHHKIKAESVRRIKEKYPDALLLVHPECTPDVLALADYVGSTQGIIDYATESKHDKFIIGTEMGVMHPLERDNPEKTFYLMDSELVCPNMKITRLESVLRCLESDSDEFDVNVPEDVAERARAALARMMELAK